MRWTTLSLNSAVRRSRFFVTFKDTSIPFNEKCPYFACLTFGVQSRRSLRIGQPKPSGRCARRILFSAAKCSLLQQDLIRYSRHVCEQPRHLCVLHGKAHHGLPLFPTPSDIDLKGTSELDQ